MLNAKELKQLCVLLKKIDNPHEGLPQPVFEALLGVVTFAAVELVIKSPRGVLLTWRDDQWWRGWHFPGGLLRFRESFDERIQAVAWKELGINVSDSKFLFANDCSQGSRGHTVSLVFECRTIMKPKKGRFFKTMPKNIIDGHRGFWQRVMG
ncbi:NUDIX hydrolase [Patescibacteria group bacterium]|nr:MAG: NUDIX hydrolase [Patescibacteria group bacterium]